MKVTFHQRRKLGGNKKKRIASPIPMNSSVIRDQKLLNTKEKNTSGLARLLC